MALSPKQAAFVLEYLVDFNATAAAKRSGYSEKTAMQQGSRLLKVPKIAEAISKALAERETEIKHRAARVAEEVYAQSIARLTDALDESGNVRPVKDWPEELKRALAGCEVSIVAASRGEADDGPYERGGAAQLFKLKLADKRASQELFLKYAGKLREQVEHTGKDGAPISVVFNLSPVRSE